MVFGVLLAVVGASVLLTLNRTLWPPDDRRARPPRRRPGPPRRPTADRHRKPGKPRKPGEVPRITAPCARRLFAAAVRAGSAHASSARAASAASAHAASGRNSPQVVPSVRADRATYGESRGAGAGPGAGARRAAGGARGRAARRRVRRGAPEAGRVPGSPYTASTARRCTGGRRNAS